MRIVCIVFLLLISACGEAAEPSNQPLAPEAPPARGYDAYIFACTTDGEKEEVCKCQADSLAKQLTDEKIFILAEAGVAASNGDIEQIDYVMENHPDILVAMQNLSLDAEICYAAGQVELENIE